jgi:hypothetical protein
MTDLAHFDAADSGSGGSGTGARRFPAALGGADGTSCEIG